MAFLTLAQPLDKRTTTGTLYTSGPEHALTCYACGHRCRIKPGRRGICQVRFNEGGVLKVPWGYVGALQCDPTEKKPFFHLYPGSDTLTFGMLGCDLHCSYCLTPETWIVTNTGIQQLGDLFEQAAPFWQRGEEAVRRPLANLQVYTHTGQLHPVTKIFKHPYRGRMLKLQPFYFPALHCTPEHEIFATLNPNTPPQFVRAQALTSDHWLALPKHYPALPTVSLDTTTLLTPYLKPFRTPHDIGAAQLTEILQLTEAGFSSREIGQRIGKSASHVRHLRGKLKRGEWEVENLATSSLPLSLEDGRVRLPKEHRPGIPASLKLDTAFAKLLGYYCAEGSVVHNKKRLNSTSLNFSFGHHESHLVDEVSALLQTVFGVTPKRVVRPTTLSVTTSKTAVALCFEALCGQGSRHKQVPTALFQAPPAVVESFLRAYAVGDGHTRANGMTQITTVSEALAHGIAWLALKCGFLPAFSRNGLGQRPLLGRVVNASQYQYSVNWYFEKSLRKFAVSDAQYWYVRLHTIETDERTEPVYNLEVAGEHSYIANLLTTHNCQNWVTSQALRDPASEQAGAAPSIITPKQMVALAQQHGATLIGSSYNEPLITSEWAAAIFAEATQAGLKCVYVSNGNATPEVLDYLQPHLTGYKIDLKTMSDKNYRRLGAVLNNVLEGIRQVQARGLWLEIVTLIIPGFNDSDAELKDAAQFLAALSLDIPWHVTAFHQDYKMTTPDPTRASALQRAVAIGRAAGLRYVYAGNLPGQVGDAEHTFCPHCHAKVIERSGFHILDYALTADGACPHCHTRLAGHWPTRPEVVRRSGARHPRRVNPSA